MVKTVGDFVKDAESLQAIRSDTGKSLKEAMMDATYIWSNDACVGYCIKAMEHSGISADDRGLVIDYLRAQFDCVSIQDADEWGRKGQ